MKSTDELAPTLLDTVLSTLQNGVIIYQIVRDGAGRLVDLQPVVINKAAEQDMGGPIEMIFGRSYKQLFPKAGGDALFDYYRLVVETGQPARFEFNFVRPGGVALWVDVSARLLNDTLVVSYNDITKPRADAEAARRAELLERAFDASISGVTVLAAVRDEQGQISNFRFEMINEAGLRMGGYTRDELLGCTLWELYPATRINGLFDQYVQVCETGVPYSGEHYYPEHDTWREITVVPISGGVMLTYLDITPRKKADAVVVEQAQLLTDIMESGPIGVAVMKAVYANDGAARRLTNFRVVRINSLLQQHICGSDVELTGQLLTDAFLNAHESGILSRCLMSVELSERQEFEMPYQVNGQRRWYRMSMAPNADQLILAITDITDTKKAQLAYHSQAQLLSSVLDGSQNSIIAFDAVRDELGAITDFRYILQNETNRRKVNRTDEQVLGHTMLEYFPSVKENGLLAQYAEVVETGIPYRQDVIFDYGNGPGCYNLSVVRRDDGIVLTVQDKTAEKQAEDSLLAHQQQLEAANTELRRSNENLQSFAYMASHDLQEPLRKIQAFGDILKSQRGGALGSDIDLLERMQSAANRMSVLIRDLLAYSRLSTRQDNMASVPLGDVVGDVLTNLELAVTESGAVIDIPELPTLHGDASQLRQLFQNLFSNALKFRHPDVPPRVQVCCERVAATDLPATLHHHRKKAFYRIDIQDNGIGFDPQHTERIFQVFQRLHGKNQYVGTGIGLAICDKVAANHGGAITATSQPGEGATFSVYLPV